MRLEVIDRLLGRVVAVIEWWAMFLLSAMAALVCWAVFTRYALNSSLVWYDEFASYLLVWLTFYGSVVADYHRRHISFDLFVNKMAPGTRRAVDIVGETAVLGFQFVLCYYGWILSERMGDETAISLPWIQIAWVNSVLPITGALMLLISFARLVALISGRTTTPQGGHGTWSGSSSE